MEAVLVLPEGLTLFDAPLDPTREAGVGGRVGNSEAATAGEGWLGASDTDGGCAEVLSLVECVMPHDHDTEARFENTGLG